MLRNHKHYSEQALSNSRTSELLTSEASLLYYNLWIRKELINDLFFQKQTPEESELTESKDVADVSEDEEHLRTVSNELVLPLLEDLISGRDFDAALAFTMLVHRFILIGCRSINY